jgi:predicted dehydrogenase
MKTLALVGAAHIHTPGFIKKLKERPDVRVKSVWDHDAARAALRAGELGAATVRSVKEVWADPEVEAAVICSETRLHGELVAAGAKAGKHLFVEKPLGMGAKDALAMAAAIRRAGVLFQTGYFVRGNPAYLCIREQLAAGSFGTVTRVRGSNCHAGALKGWFDKEWRWMADPKQAGCGGFGDLGTHSLDILLWLFGPVEAVAGRLAAGSARYPSCDELGEALLAFRSGVIGTLAASWDDVANPVSLLVAGTEGHAAVVSGQLFFQSAKVAGADGKTPWTALPAAWPHAFDLFLDALAGKAGAPLVTADEAAERSVVMEAIYRAAKAGSWVKLPKPADAKAPPKAKGKAKKKS